MKIEFDLEKSQKNRVDRGFDFAFAARIFDKPALLIADDRMDYGEVRTIAVGEIEGKIYKVVFTDRGKVRRIISAHRASRQEIRRWRMSE